MKVLRHLQAFCIALFVLHTGADITLTAVTPLNSMLIKGLRVRVGFECGFRVTFVCKIKPYTNGNTVVWQVNSKTYALCLFQNCFNYPPYPAYHGISMSLATETFNLTTDPITLAARRSIYSCNDGVTALSVDAIVKVYVNNETLKMDTSKTNQITLTTGCVYPYGRDDMSFKWFISKDRMILQQSPFVRDDIQSIQPFACVETSDCAGAESVRFNSTITVAVDIFDTGEDYYICAAVQHIDAPDRPRAVHCSVRTYKIRNYIRDGSPRTFAFWKILLIILVIYRILFLLQYSLFLCENGTQNDFPFLVKTTKVKSNVYCFICKVYMCEQCFRKHRRLDCVLEKNEHLKQLKRSRDETYHIADRPAPSNGRIALSCMPIIGFIYNVLKRCNCKHVDTRSISPEPDAYQHMGKVTKNVNSSPKRKQEETISQQTPKPLKRVPSVTSRQQLQEYVQKCHQ